MTSIIVVNRPGDWPLNIEGVDVVSTKEYINNPVFGKSRSVKIYNLCGSYRYQSYGYYVSLLAEARQHRPMPSINTILDMRSQSMVRFISDELDELTQKSLHGLQSSEFVLSIYFGRNLAKKYHKLARLLFNQFPSPLLRAKFILNQKWLLHAMTPIAARDIPAEHHDFVVQSAQDYFANKRRFYVRKSPARYDLAILINRDEKMPPSNEGAINKFVKAGRKLGFDVECITREDYGRIAEFDALFIRETTAVNHHTFRFSRRGHALNLVTIDDPASIIKCTNKVFLAELFRMHGIDTPETRIVTKSNFRAGCSLIQTPCIIKQPDSSFSQGVIKADNRDDYMVQAGKMLERSDLIIVQSFMPTEFDWRVCLLNGEPLFVCKYYMARRHWQIVKHQEDGHRREGNAQTLPVEAAPETVVKLAIKACAPIGRGLYGVDIKQIEDRFVVIEINDNPSIDAGVEDKVLKDALYLKIMKYFSDKIEEQKSKWS